LEDRRDRFFNSELIDVLMIVLLVPAPSDDNEVVVVMVTGEMFP
jgi:hypothetical protein